MKLLTVIRDAFADEADGLGRITKALSIADGVTLSNAVVGLLGVYFAATGRVEVAASLIALAVVLDGTDGIAARLWGGGPLGPFLDTLADLLSFGILPAVLLAVAFPAWSWWAFAVGGLYLVCAMLRLARFEVLREESTPKYYSGMTSTGAGVLVAVTILAGLPPVVVLVWAVLLSMWMVSRIRTVKLTFWPLVFGAMTLFPTFLGTVVPLPRTWTLAALLTGMTVYTFVGPFYILGKYGATPHPAHKTSPEAD